MNADHMSEVPRRTMVDRVLNVVAITVISLSVLLQSISFYILLSKKSEDLDSDTLFVLGLFGLVVFPGIILAFIKLLLNIIRSFKDDSARIKVAFYFIISAWPFLGVALATFNTTHPLFNRSMNEETKSAQYRVGYDWAIEHKPSSNGECHGSQEFNRGCWEYIKGYRDKDFLAGREWAKINLPVKASQCTGSVAFIKGCRIYFGERLEKPKPAGESRYEGMTTAECRIEVNANFEALTREFIENGNPHGAESTRRRSWDPALKDCENYDKLAENTFMPQATNRLQLLLNKLKARNQLTEDEKAAALNDFTEMSKVHDQPYKTYYLEQFAEYQDRLSGLYKEPITIYPRITCAEYQKKIDAMKLLDKERVAEMKALESEDGRRISNGVKHDELNQERLDMLWDWKLYNDGAKVAGCEIK